MVTVCCSQARSAQAVAILQRAGFRDVANLAGGMLRWRAEKEGVNSGFRAELPKARLHFALRRLLNSENRLDSGTQRFELEWLGNIAIGSVCHPVQHAFRGYVPGKHDDGDGAKPGVLPQLLQ